MRDSIESKGDNFLRKPEGFSSPEQQDLERTADDAVKRMVGDPGFLAKLKKYKGALYFIIALKLAAIATPAFAGEKQDDKSDLKAKTSASEKVEQKTLDDPKDKTAIPVDDEVLKALFGPAQDQVKDIKDKVAGGEKMFLDGDAQGGKILDKDGKAVYDYKVSIDEKGKPSVDLKPIAGESKAKVTDKSYKIKVEGEKKITKSAHDFLEDHKDLVDNAKYKEGYKLGHDTQAPDKIKIIKGNASENKAVFRVQMSEIINNLNAKVQTAVDSLKTSSLSAEDKDLLSKEIGRTVGIVDAYQEALDNTK